MRNLNLDSFDSTLHAAVRSAVKSGNASQLIPLLTRGYELDFVWKNAERLLKSGIYEPVLVHAFVNVKNGLPGWPIELLDSLFGRANRKKLLEAGQPIPVEDEFTLYRGVSGIAPYRKEDGMSWTRSIECALRFAERNKHHGDQAIYKTTVPASEILFYSHERGEDEFILRAKSCHRMSDSELQIEVNRIISNVAQYQIC